MVTLIIFCVLRSFRSTSSSALRSHFGAWARSRSLYSRLHLERQTFGGLALGIGMVVDAAIVVPRKRVTAYGARQGSRDGRVEGSEEVWSAIVASILTHIAVSYAPLLTGISSISSSSCHVSSSSPADVAARGRDAPCPCYAHSPQNCRRRLKSAKDLVASYSPSETFLDTWMTPTGVSCTRPCPRPTSLASPPPRPPVTFGSRQPC